MSDIGSEVPQFCSRCGRPVTVRDAIYCKECGAPLALAPRTLGWNLALAAALSLLPGLGHFYKGQPGRAALWFLVVLISYSLQPLGLMMHVICAANAAFAGEDRPARYRLLNRRRAMPGRFGLFKPWA